MDIERFLGLSMSYVSHVVRLSLQRLHWILHRTWQSHWLWKMLTAMRQSIWELKENSFFIPSSLQKTFNLKTKFLVFLQCTGLVKCLCCSVWQETTSSFILLRCRTSLTSTQVNGLPSAPHRWTTHLMNAVCMGKLSAYRIYLQHWWQPVCRWMSQGRKSIVASWDVAVMSHRSSTTSSTKHCKENPRGSTSFLPGWPAAGGQVWCSGMRNSWVCCLSVCRAGYGPVLDLSGGHRNSDNIEKDSGNRCIGQR